MSSCMKQSDRLTINAVDAKLLHQCQCCLREFLPASLVSSDFRKWLTAFATSPNRQDDAELRVLLFQ